MHHNRSSNKRPRSPPPSQVAAPPANTRFKGVVPQTSGHWGAQIYANRQRIWLGTFKSEKEAAMAYDTASIKLRSSDSYRNFPFSQVTMHEPFFQKFHTTESVLNMIKDGSYTTKFFEFLNQNQANSNEEDSKKYTNVAVGSSFFMEKFSCHKLFRKELTPSDVGKLNRLVIPKKFAVKYFPEMNQENEVLLNFHDGFGRLWKFRYCYWKSSQSFVFTRGWNKFVKEKKLKDKDVITFFECEGDPEALKNGDIKENERSKVSSKFYLIDVSCRRAKKDDGDGEDDVIDDMESEVAEEKDECSVREVQEEEKGGSSEKTMSISIRLFGVDIQQ